MRLDDNSIKPQKNFDDYTVKDDSKQADFHKFWGKI